MDSNHTALIEAEMRTAREKLRAARALMDMGLVPDSISRAYYAVFHAGKAALVRKGIHSESHVGLKTLFGLHLVEKGVLPRRLGKILSELMERREAADYDVWTSLDEEDARRSNSDAAEFIDAIDVFLSTTGT